MIKKEFWVTNISREYDVALSDLRLTIRRGRTVNLLDGKHYSYTYEQLKESADNGSIKRKSSVIKVLEKAPKPRPKMILESKNDLHVLRRTNNAVKVNQPYYEELEVREDEPVELMDSVYHDHAPALAVDEKFNKKE